MAKPFCEKSMHLYNKWAEGVKEPGGWERVHSFECDQIIHVVGFWLD
jgi:hypothetical protein